MQMDIRTIEKQLAAAARRFVSPDDADYFASLSMETHLKKSPRTNPLAYAIPTADNPMVLDMATTEIPFFDIKSAKEKGIPLQNNVAVDRHGKLTTVAEEALSDEGVASATHWRRFQGLRYQPADRSAHRRFGAEPAQHRADSGMASTRIRLSGPGPGHRQLHRQGRLQNCCFGHVPETACPDTGRWG